MPRRGLDLQNYLPFYLSQIANKWSWSSSRIYLERFGIGINEWRVMTQLATEPGIPANRVCFITGIDKALVGRSIRILEQRKLAVARSDPSDRRSRSVRLTPAGMRVHGQILEIALRREKLLLARFTKAEIRTLLRLLRRLAENAARLGPDPR